MSKEPSLITTLDMLVVEDSFLAGQLFEVMIVDFPAAREFPQMQMKRLRVRETPSFTDLFRHVNCSECTCKK